MTVRPILRWPDPLLRTPAAAVTVFDAVLRALADDLLDTMRAAPGVGITAPHVGVLTRLVVLELPDDPSGVRVYVNPRVVWAAAEQGRHEEGSVSLPGVTAEVARPVAVRIAYQDLDGAEQTQEADGFLAVCLQHEIDQLDGIFWTRRLSRLKRDQVMRRVDKLARQAKP